MTASKSFASEAMGTPKSFQPLEISRDASLEGKKEYLLSAMHTIFKKEACKEGDPFSYLQYIYTYLDILSQCVDLHNEGTYLNTKISLAQKDLSVFFLKNKDILEVLYTIGDKLKSIGNHPNYDQLRYAQDKYLFTHLANKIVKIYAAHGIYAEPIDRLIKNTQIYENVLKLLQIGKNSAITPAIYSTLEKLKIELEEIIAINSALKIKKSLLDIVNFPHTSSLMEILSELEINDSSELPSSPFASMTQNEIFKHWVTLAHAFVKSRDTKTQDIFHQNFLEFRDFYLFDSKTYELFLSHIPKKLTTLREKEDYLLFLSLTIFTAQVTHFAETESYDELSKDFIEVYLELLSELAAKKSFKKSSKDHIELQRLQEFFTNFNEINSGILNAGAKTFDHICDEVFSLLQESEGSENIGSSSSASSKIRKKMLEKQDKLRLAKFEKQFHKLVNFLDLIRLEHDVVNPSKPYIALYVEVFETLVSKFESLIIEINSPEHANAANQKLLKTQITPSLEILQKKAYALIEQNKVIHAENGKIPPLKSEKTAQKKKKKNKKKKIKKNHSKINDDELSKNIDEIWDLLLGEIIHDEALSLLNIESGEKEEAEISLDSKEENVSSGKEPETELEAEEHVSTVKIQSTTSKSDLLKNEHLRLMQKLDPLVKGLLNTKKADDTFPFFIYGGWIRDTLLNLTPRNYNLVFAGSEKELLSLKLLGFSDFHIRKFGFKGNQYFVEIPGNLSIKIRRVDSLASHQDFIKDTEQLNAYVNMLYMNFFSLFDPTDKAFDEVMNSDAQLNTHKDASVLFEKDAHQILDMIYLKVKLKRLFASQVEGAIENPDILLKLKEIPFTAVVRYLEKIIKADRVKGFANLYHYRIIQTLFPEFAPSENDEKFFANILENENQNFLDFHLAQLFLQSEVRKLIKKEAYDLERAIKTVLTNHHVLIADDAYPRFYHALRDSFQEEAPQAREIEAEPSSAQIQLLFDLMDEHADIRNPDSIQPSLLPSLGSTLMLYIISLRQQG